MFIQDDNSRPDALSDIEADGRSLLADITRRIAHIDEAGLACLADALAAYEASLGAG